MHRRLRIIGTLLALGGVLTLVWALLVWQWMDPFTGLYTKWRQHQLASQYERRAEAYRAPATAGSLAAERQLIARAARVYRAETRRGDAIGRIRIPRMGLNMVLVDGTDHTSQGTARRISRRSPTSTTCGGATPSRSRFRTGRSSTGFPATGSSRAPTSACSGHRGTSG